MDFFKKFLKNRAEIKDVGPPAPQVAEQAAKQPITKPSMAPGEGIRSMDATNLFKITNFELFMRPNKYVMAFGIITMSGCVAYIGYWNLSERNNPANKLYTAINEDDTISIRARKSRWD